MRQRVKALEESLPSPREACSSLRSTEPTLLVPRLTLVVALPLFETTSFTVLGLMAAGVAVALLTPPLLRWGWLFIAVAAARFLWQLTFWEMVDNHEWLITWWTLAVGCCLLTSAPQRSLARCATVMIGLTFVFAAFWKVAGGAFLDGRFFEFMLLTDARLEAFAERFGGLAEGNIAESRQTFEQVQAAAGPPRAAELTTSTEVRGLALLMSWWGLAIEAAIAVVYLVPSESRWVRGARVWTVVAFCATTYLLLPVVYFAAALIVMAIAAAPRRYVKWLLLTLAVVATWTGFVALWGLPL